MKKYKYLLFSALSIILFFAKAKFISAMEVSLPGLGNNPTLSQYIVYLFNFGISLAGGLALISFIVGAVTFIAAGGGSGATDAKDRMISAILGLLIIAGSWLIIDTINPKLETLTLNALPSTSGVFLTNGQQQKQCPQQYPDTSTIPSGFNTIKYVCSGSSDPALLVWMFPNANYSGTDGSVAGYGGITVKRVECGGQTGVNGSSFLWKYDTTGIYYCLDGCNGDMCSGYMSDANTSSQDNIAGPFSGNIQGVRIVNSAAKNLFYGAIFHGSAGLANGGDCTLPITNQFNDGAKCMPIDNPNNTVAANIVLLNKNPDTSGNGVTFYSKPWGKDTGATAGYWPGADTTDPNNKENMYTKPDDPDSYNVSSDMRFVYDGVDATEAYQNECETFQDKGCAGSMLMGGNYLVAVYDDNGTRCQTFEKADANNFKTTQIISGEDSTLGNIYIIATQ